MNDYKTLTTLNVFRFLYLIYTELDDEYPYNMQECMTDMNIGPSVNEFMQFLRENYSTLLETKLNYLDDEYIAKKFEYAEDENAIILSYLIDRHDEPSVQLGNSPNLGVFLYAEFLVKKNLTDCWNALNEMFESDWDCESFEECMIDLCEENEESWPQLKKDAVNAFNEAQNFVTNAMTA